MDNANKIISFVLGLIVVIVVLLLITGRLGLFKGKNILPISRGNTATPTVTPSPTPKKTAQNSKQNNSPTPTPKRLALNAVATATPMVQNNNQINEQKESDNIKTIPSTGSSSDILVVMILGLISGVYLRKVKVSS